MPDQIKTLPDKGDGVAASVDLEPRTGGQMVADALRIHGVDRIFCVPGESYVAVLDALVDMPEIQLVVARHEGAAANMAEADGKLTGRPGICFVTRGPGATHASVGVHTAFLDSTPMILFVGQVPRKFRGREAFQEIDLKAFFAPISKWVAEVDDAGQIPEIVQRAFGIATSGRPGPVVVSLPEDVLETSRQTADCERMIPSRGVPKPNDLEAFYAELARARRPLLILGGSCWNAQGLNALRRFAEANCLPVAASFRRQDLFPNQHPCYVGHLTIGSPQYLGDLVRSSDLVIAFGTRLGEAVTGGYALLEPPRPKQRLIHIHAGEHELGRVYRADLQICAEPSIVAEMMSSFPAIENPAWEARTRDARRAFEQYCVPPDSAPSAWSGPSQTGVDLAQVVAHLSRRLPADAQVSNGAGNYTMWVHRFFEYKQLRTQLAPTSGAMGYGLPAAIAAKLRNPERITICFAGDGCFLMYPQELATALQTGAAVIVLVVNNGMYGTIRMHQERRYPGRPIGTDLGGVDFVALAKSFGAFAERVNTTEEFAPAFERAAAAGIPAVLELMVDPNQITPDQKLQPDHKPHNEAP